MDETQEQTGAAPVRMQTWFWATLGLVIAALVVQEVWPGSVVAVTLYKAHLMALGGWGGYWLDRALFPYQRPHTLFTPPGETPEDSYARFRQESKEQASPAGG